MKTKYLYIFLFGFIISLTACDDYLDMEPTDQVSDKIVWSKVEYAELAINNFYHYINYFGSFSNGQCSAGMTEGLTDIFKYGSMTYNAYMYIPNEIAYGGSTLTANYVSVYLGNWESVYVYVRRVNEGLSNLAKYGSSISDDEVKRLTAEMRFFRGLLYFDLVKRYKDVIIYNEDLSSIQKNTPLNTEVEGWDFVEADLLYAGENLPVSTTANGRLTSGAAYALLSRAMLYAQKWDVAKSAAEKVMTMGYKLTNDFDDAFTSGNIEAIFQYSYDASGVTHSYDNYYSPAGDEGNDVTGGYGTPTQELVESFELAEGGFPNWTTWHNEDGTTVAPPYADLEPRFHATVLYNGATWKNRKVEPFVDGTDGWCTWIDDPTPDGRTTTGYYLKKLVNENHDFSTLTASTQPWIALRYAELLLNYAEACYHSGTADDIKKANDAVREIRGRVSLPYTDKSGDELMAAIRQERKVELAFEGLYYWDMKRWELAETEFTGLRVHGLKIVKISDEIYKYSYVDCDKQDRNFPAKMYQIPLPADELNNNSSVQQYEEWR